MIEAFADTLSLLALVSPHDGAHEKALSASQNLSAALVPTASTAWILTEFADALVVPYNCEACIQILGELRHRSKCALVGFECNRNRPAQGWSLTDCISFVVMWAWNNSDALAGDHHFEQAGVVALLARCA